MWLTYYFVGLVGKNLKNTQRSEWRHRIQKPLHELRMLKSIFSPCRSEIQNTFVKIDVILLLPLERLIKGENRYLGEIIGYIFSLSNFYKSNEFRPTV